MGGLKQGRREPRKYNGNPLDYYLSHADEFKLYENRTQLSRGDSGMYRALIRYKQIGKVFPNTKDKNIRSGRRGGKIGGKRGPLLEKDNLEVIASYDSFHGNAMNASKHLPYAYSTILKHWRDAGLSAVGNVFRSLPQKKVVRIINSYKIYHGNAMNASKHLDCCSNTIIRYWRDAGFIIRKKGRPRKE